MSDVKLYSEGKRFSETREEDKAVYLTSDGLGSAQDAEELRDALGLSAAGSGFYVDVTEYGATGDGTTDDTASIQSAIDAAESARANVYFPDGEYKITSALVIQQSGTRVFGQNAEHTKIRQATDGEHGFYLRNGGSPIIWGPHSRQFAFERLGIYSTGRDTSTGSGIFVDPQDLDPPLSAPIVQAIRLTEVTVRDWGTGVFLRRVDQNTFKDCMLAYCGTGIDTDISCNSTILQNLSIVRCSTVGAIFASAGGTTVIGGDFGNHQRTFRLKQGGPVVIEGANFESLYDGGQEHVYVEQNASVNVTGCRFLVGSGTDGPLVRVASYGTATVNDSTTNGSAPIVEGESANSVILGNWFASNLGYPTLMKTSDGDEVALSPLPTIRDDSPYVTTAYDRTRGSLFRVVSRSGTADKLVYHYRDAAGAYQVATLV